MGPNLMTLALLVSLWTLANSVSIGDWNYKQFQVPSSWWKFPLYKKTTQGETSTNKRISGNSWYSSSSTQYERLKWWLKKDCRTETGYLQKKLTSLEEKYFKKLDGLREILTQVIEDKFADVDTPIGDFCKKTVGTNLINTNIVEEPCVLSQWSQWKVIAFGSITRQRTILKPGCGCPSKDDLVQTIDISNYIGNNTDTFQEPDTVGDNFECTFINNCNNNTIEPRDILIILDSSASIKISDLALMIEGLTTMIDLFCGGFGEASTNNRLAIVQFSSKVRVVHRFSDPQSPEILKDVVTKLIHYKGNTCTGDALQESYKSVFRADAGMRDFTVKDTLLVTDGQSNCGKNLRFASNNLQKVSNVFALGVGIAKNPMAREEVSSVVSSRDARHVFSLAKFSDFKAMVESIKKRKKGDPCLPIVGKN